MQAKNYVESRKIRAWVLQRILDQVGTPERLVIVGHSLGSVVAADVLRRLPPEGNVVGMVTIGSPLAYKALLALRYAHLTMNQFEGETQDRYADAIRHVQAETFALVKDRNLSQNRAMPSSIAELSVDLGDPSARAPESTVPGHWSTADAIVPLIAIATMNVIRPFEIEVAKTKRRAAMEQLALEMGFGRRVGVGLASPTTSAAAVEAVVATQLASAILRDVQGLQQDPQVWRNLTELERAVTRELTQLEAVSDESAPSLKELRRKLGAIRRALVYLERNGLGPEPLSLVDGND